MTDGINRIFGGNNYGVGGFGARKQEEPKESEVKEAVKDYKETQVDPSRVMDLLAANSNVLVCSTNKTNHIELDQATQDRIADSMKNFELFMSVASEEVGEDLALLLADEYIQI